MRQHLIQKPKATAMKATGMSFDAKTQATVTTIPSLTTKSSQTALTQSEQELLSAWQTYKKNGLEFGRLCREWCEQFKAQGSHRGLGFEQLCTKLGIPRRTAYHWIRKFEISAGHRKAETGLPKPEETGKREEAKREERYRP